MSKTSKAVAIADLEEGAVLARVDIAATPERVFRALTTDELTQWWGSPTDYKTTRYTIDLRPGGTWRTDGVGLDGSPFHVEGEVLEVDPPRRLVYTWKPSFATGAASKVAYTIDATPTGTRVTVRHTGFTSPEACDSHANGWVRVLGWLGGFEPLVEQTRHFVIRLVPPRPTFMLDMTAEEGAIMQAHVGYWMGLLAEGQAIVFGPVADPAGAWGLGVVRAPDEAAVRALEANDPAIAAQRGFRYEILPMARAVY
jgi:uncharacterized protein YndB with AHSA1/START domain